MEEEKKRWKERTTKRAKDRKMKKIRDVLKGIRFDVER